MIITDDELIDMAVYIVENRATVRQTAREYGISKSGVHFAVTKRLQLVNTSMARSVREVLQENTEARAARGGRARWSRDMTFN